MRVLVACEFSGIVREEFRKIGHDAWSCDLLPTEIPGQHIQDDVLKHLDDGWDLMIAHPPCTHLAVSGARHFHKKKMEQELELRFVRRLMDASIEKICIENPVSIISSRIRKSDQMVNPWMFGDEFSKRTCFWLKNLPKLKPTKIVGKGEIQVMSTGNRMPKWYNKARNDLKTRQRTFPGIAKAMAEQWGKSK